MVEFIKICGCKIHGTTDGQRGTFIVNKNKKVKFPIYICNKCQKVYFGSGIDMGKTRELKYREKTYKVEAVMGPTELPEKLYIKSQKMCKCFNKHNRLTVDSFLLSSGNIVHFTAYCCKTCGRYYISSKGWEKNKEIISKTGIEVIGHNNEVEHFKNDEKNSDVLDCSENINSNRQIYYNYQLDWKAAINESDEEEGIDTYEELKPASKVASAYSEANILYNPYQYLPWLKMFINGENKLLISDEVGLGKTIEAGILISEQFTEDTDSKIIIICPAFLRDKWYSELRDKFVFDAQIFDGHGDIDSATNIVILPLSRLKSFLSVSENVNPSMIIIDEVHYFKNSKSNRYKYLTSILANYSTPKYVFMSATPINNTGNDYASIRKLFGEDPARTNTTKKQAYIFLPERYIEDVYVDLSDSEERFYRATDALDPFSGTVYRHIGASCLYALNRYAYSNSELSSETKDELRSAIEVLIDDIEIDDDNDDFLYALKKIELPEVDSKLLKLKGIIEALPVGTKIVIFSHYIETVKYLYSQIKKEYCVGYIYANNLSDNIPYKSKENKFFDAKDWFVRQNADKTILICSDSCREGIDLDVANVLINYDLPFNPSILEQRIGRIDRMSQKKEMKIFNFHVNDTYDDRLHFILDTKLRLINYYAEYGIGNPLNITANQQNALDSFIRYFGKRITGIDNRNNDYASMSNEDFSIASKILKRIGIKLKTDDETDALHMQARVLDALNKNKSEIVEWFAQSELKDITDEQLVKEKEKLNNLLGFPEKIKRKVKLNDAVIHAIAVKAQNNIRFRKKVAGLILDYDKKLEMVELTGNPMVIDDGDFLKEYEFGTGKKDSFVQTSVIEMMRNEGAEVYEIE